MSSIADAAWLADLHRAPRTVVVVDMVESVRLIERYEEPTIRRWRSFVQTSVQEDVLPRGGRLVKSLGDGMMLEFTEPLPAVQCALALQARLAALNEPLDAEERMDARIGIHAADVIVQEEDIYGAGVNLAARVATLAGPGEIVVTPAVRDQVVDGLDAISNDMGDCYLKHVEEPIRAYRLSSLLCNDRLPVGSTPTADIRPVIAVIPLDCRDSDLHGRTLGDVIVDNINSAFCRSERWRVVSRLSCERLRGRGLAAAEVAQLVSAQYVVSGRYIWVSGRNRVSIELTDARSDTLLWSEVFFVSDEQVLAAQDELTPAVVKAVSLSIIQSELRRTEGIALPALDGYAALLRGIGLMHRLAKNEFELSERALTYLIDRYPKAVEPKVWLIKWYTLKIAQRWSADPARDFGLARQLAEQALQTDPNHAMALALDGQVNALSKHDLVQLDARLSMALTCNPNEPIAWLFQSGLCSYRGDGPAAVQALAKAQGLSPLDPLSFLFDSYAGLAHLVNRDWAAAFDVSERAIKTNRMHVPTYFWLIIAQVRLGLLEQATETAKTLAALSPKSSASRFVAGYAGGPRPFVKEFGEALVEAGFPK